MKVNRQFLEDIYLPEPTDKFKPSRKYLFRDRYFDKYRPIFKRILRSNIGNNWSDIYSEISQKIPPVVKHKFIKWYVKMPDRNGLYTSLSWKFEHYRDYYYVQDGILKYYTRHKNRKKTYKTIKKKIAKPDPLFKYDYDLEFVTFSKNSPFSKQRVRVQTGEVVDENGKVIPKYTYFTSEEFIDWAERHLKTYRLRFYTYYGFSKTLMKTISKESYDNN